MRRSLHGLVGAALVALTLVAVPEAAYAATYSYTGPAVPIPDGGDLSGNNPGAPVTATVTVAGEASVLTDINFRFDGTACSATAGSTTVGLSHTFANDLEISLTSPMGTTVKLIDNTDGSGNNFCQTLLDDDAGAASIQTAVTANAPFTGIWAPANPLAAFDGQNPNGTWTLRVQDFFSADTGNIRAWSLIISSGNAVTINQAVGQTDPTSVAPINFTATFSTNVTGFTGTDVTLGGTAPGTLSAVVTGGPSIYNVAVSGMTGAGTVTASIGANVVNEGNAAATSTDNSVFFGSAPVVTNVSPRVGSTAGGDAVTITGSGFTGATSVEFGTGNPAANFVVADDNTITAASPVHPHTGRVFIRVTTPGGTSATGPGSTFHFATQPTVTGVFPNSGPLSGGNRVVVIGTSFVGTPTVKFGSVPGTKVEVGSFNRITVTAPAGAEPGEVTVSVTTTFGTSPANPPASTYDYVAG